MKTIAKRTAAALTLAFLGAVAAQSIDAHVMTPAVPAPSGDGARDAKTYADWQGPLTQSFGSRVLTQGAPWDAKSGATSGRTFTLQPFDGLDKMQVWQEPPGQKAL